MKPTHLQALKNLALLGALRSRIPISSAKFGKRMGLSQQSASRILRELQNDEMIDISRGRKSWIRITEKGSNVLMREYGDYRSIFEEGKPVIKGRVESGMGEGRYYLSKIKYREQIEKIFGFEPYPGTLNVRLSMEEMAKYRRFAERSHTIQGFVSEGRTFGDVLALKAEIEGIKCAVIIPKRSHYSDVIEIIAPLKLRDILDLNDGDELEIRVQE